VCASQCIARQVKRLDMRDGLNIHRLRKLAATRLAEAGCSAHEIAAISGHKSLAMVVLYTAITEQEKLTGAVSLRLSQPASQIDARKKCVSKIKA
jgi:integrase